VQIVGELLQDCGIIEFACDTVCARVIELHHQMTKVMRIANRSFRSIPVSLH
jgi:hypothetical protein